MDSKYTRLRQIEIERLSAGRMNALGDCHEGVQPPRGNMSRPRICVCRGTVSIGKLGGNRHVGKPYRLGRDLARLLPLPGAGDNNVFNGIDFPFFWRIGADGFRSLRYTDGSQRLQGGSNFVTCGAAKPIRNAGG